MKKALFASAFLLGLTLGTFPAACLADDTPAASQQDRQQTELVIGKWLFEDASSDGNMQGTVVYAADGSFDTKMVATYQHRRVALRIQGKWRLENGYLVTTFTAMTPPVMPVGKVYRDKLVSIDDKQMVYVSERDETETLLRVPSSPSP